MQLSNLGWIGHKAYACPRLQLVTCAREGKNVVLGSASRPFFHDGRSFFCPPLKHTAEGNCHSLTNTSIIWPALERALSTNRLLILHKELTRNVVNAKMRHD